MTFEAPCPDCSTTNQIHEKDCEYADTRIEKIRKAYTDILSVLLAEGGKRAANEEPPGISYQTLREGVNDILQQQAPEHRGLWIELHNDCLHELKHQRRVAEQEEMGGIYLKSPEERQQDIIPTFEPLKTIYEYGPVDGAKDYAVYSMVSWTELVGLDWNQACNFLTEWLEETGSWDELSWGEHSIQQLLDSKKHIHDRSLGWGDYAEIAADHIRESDKDRRIDAYSKTGEIDDASDYD